MIQGAIPAKRKTTWLWWAGVLSIVTICGWWGYGRWLQGSSGAVLVQVSTVERDTIEDLITQPGVVKLAEQRSLESVTEGRVDQVFVDVGERITAGQRLLLLQDDTWETKQLQHQIDVQKQELSLEEQRRAIASATITLQDAQVELTEDEALFEQGYISGNDLNESQRAVRQAEEELTGARLQLEQGLLEMRSLQLQAQELEQELQDQLVLAPDPAIILDLKVQRGSVVDISTPLMVLGDPSRELVYLDMSPLLAQRVQLQQSAQIKTIGPSAATYTGKVIDISRLVGTGEQENAGTEQSTLEVIVELDAPSESLVPGTRVSVDILLNQRVDVVTVDAGAIQQSPEGSFVWMLGEDNTAQKQSVTIGLEGLTTVEVIEGLEVGDEIITLPERPLEEGMTVEPMDFPGIESDEVELEGV